MVPFIAHLYTTPDPVLPYFYSQVMQQEARYGRLMRTWQPWSHPITILHHHQIHYEYHYPSYPSIMAHGLLEWQGNTQEYHPLCLEITPHRHRWVTREGGSWLPRMLTQSSHPILISCVMPVLEQLKSESAFLYLVFFIIFYTHFFHKLTFTYYSIVITIHLSNLPFPLIHWWYNHEVHTQESLRP